MGKMTWEEMLDLTRKIIKRFEKIEGKPWGVEGGMMELMKQVGELSRLVMSYEQYYFADRGQLDSEYLATKEKIGDELSDILFMTIRIADHYDIDLMDAHVRALQEADEFLKTKE